jgi:hypothetical protein
MYITTSWDDGHPLDFRVAELLVKYGLRGTFYVPQCTPHGTMTTAQIRELGSAFELGAHTISHVVLTSATDQQSWYEIARSKWWLEDATGLPCVIFCPPRGRYSTRHLRMVRKAGYVGMRSVEFASLERPRERAGVLVMPTTLQAHPHSFAAFAKNSIKRAAVTNFWRFVVHGRSTRWVKLAERFLRQAHKAEGVFHLWGHSWELEENKQWKRLDEVLRIMGDYASDASSLTNGQVCQETLSRTALRVMAKRTSEKAERERAIT